MHTGWYPPFFLALIEHAALKCNCWLYQAIAQHLLEQGTDSFDMVYFTRRGSRSALAAAMQDGGAEMHVLDHDDLEGSRRLIAAQHIDILIYLALPTEKFTVLLSYSRLAPIQIHYGKDNVYCRQGATW
jgi:hypothetical protein